MYGLPHVLPDGKSIFRQAGNKHNKDDDFMHIPKRMCIACRQMKPKAELIKIVKTPNGAEVDEFQKKFGRGAYICKNRDCICAAVKKKSISKHFKMPVGDDVYRKLSEANVDG